MVRTVLITGCAGFIGSHLSEHLLNLGLKVIGFDGFSENYSRSIKEANLITASKHPNFKFYEGKVQNAKDLEQIQEEYDLVIHLAAKSGVRPSLTEPHAFYDTNVSGTVVLLEQMRKRGVNKIVFASSSSVYGNNFDRTALKEDSPLTPISPYGLSKKHGEEILNLYFHSFGISSVSLRFFTVYGPRQRPDLAIHLFFDAIQNNGKIKLFGNGETARDYTFIEDIIQGIEQSVNYLDSHSQLCEVFNLGSHAPVTLNEMVRTVKKVANSDIETLHLPENKGDVNYTHADVQKAMDNLGYQTKHSFEEGVEKFYKWFKGEE